MYALQSSAVLPARVLLVAASESVMAIDTAALRRLGVTSFALCAEPERVPAVLAEAAGGRPFDCVICPHRAKDGTAARLAAVLAADAATARTPLLFLSGDESGGRMLAQIGAGVLRRPYSAEELAVALQKAMSPLRRPLVAPTMQAEPSGRSPAVKTSPAAKPVTTSDILRVANTHLQAGRTDEAAKTFAAALRRTEDLPEACLGMAAVERARDNPEEAHHWIIRAAAGYMRRDDTTGFAALLPHLPQNSLNIFCREASALMAQGLYRRACRSFLEAAQKTGEPLHALIARACAFSDAPGRRMEILCDAFEAMGRTDTAEALRLRLLKGVRSPAWSRPSWLDRYPRLKEIVCIAGWTAQAWRHA